ncbi:MULTISPECIES: Nif3-like dinuclear metal center hexameric protein [unclassified Arenibacter]|uniref:Nif3-like dinuclear metal center hexameric protein n=1 Tax=unclassified Arenibacter TaxID=2615047 RepID=UPI000E35414A|nr:MULTISPECIES: Nif3-like dinuclear metal center hexameric protein [unclassified Arenibacter]MCM4164167.1 Nif3-like dinuclear metal center hexameric protein [Arenibacter sp. A80]RFT55965.1 Nif3-like dinuclear metal center hexameric protein [Arenibacter sp. P308M17]
MIIKQVIDTLEDLAPLDYAEDFDNVGLLVGNEDNTVSGILVTLDTLENVVEEAIAKKCNLIVSFHPIIFGGLKKVTGSNYVQRVVIKAIKHDIAIYSMHTALDNSNKGVNAKICEVLGLENTSILIPQKGTIKKLTTYVPKENAKTLKTALFHAGAGNIGNYSHCSFTVDGTGSYQANEEANPYLGKIGETHYEAESQISITYARADEQKILKALFSNHPYEEIAYELQTLENKNQNIGMGMVGNLEKPMGEEDFFEFLKKKMNVSCIRHSDFLGKKIKKVALLGGSGSFAISAAIAVNADVYVTSDLKYHQFYEAEGRILLADIGHYETEQFTKNLLVDYLTKKIPNFAVSLSESKTNPIKYF